MEWRGEVRWKGEVRSGGREGIRQGGRKERDTYYWDDI